MGYYFVSYLAFDSDGELISVSLHTDRDTYPLLGELVDSIKYDYQRYVSVTIMGICKITKAHFEALYKEATE